MIHDIQKAGIWKRIAAWMFDMILMSVLVVGCGLLLSWVLGYDGYSAVVDEAYARYETQYGIQFDITQEDYLALSDGLRQAYDDAYAALTADEAAMQAYRMMTSLSLVITTFGILLAVLIWEFFMPLWFGNGQTLGKKIFGLCLVRIDGVQINTLQLFTRTLLGKFTIETMIPVYILLMLFWGTMDLTGTLILAVLGIGQCLCLAVSRQHGAIHDLLAGTCVVDKASQTIFRSTEELIEYQKKLAAERAARQAY